MDASSRMGSGGNNAHKVSADNDYDDAHSDAAWDWPHQNYLRMEAFPIKIQERILTQLSPIDRVRVELVSKAWRGMVRENGWGPDLEFDCRCMRNFDRLQSIGFGQIVRRLVLHFRSGTKYRRDCVNGSHLTRINKIVNISAAFANLVHLRIQFSNTRFMRQFKHLTPTFVGQLRQLTALKTISLANYTNISIMNLTIFSPSLEVVVLDTVDNWSKVPLLMRPLKSVWLNLRQIMHARFYDELLPAANLRHLGLANLHLTQLDVQRIRQLKDSLQHLSFKLPLCYFVATDSCNHANIGLGVLKFDGLAQMICALSGLLSLEVDCIGPNELTLILNHCKQLEHFAFTFCVNAEVPDLSAAEMVRAMRRLPSALPNLRSLDFLLSNRVNHEPMNSLAEDTLAPTMRELADQGRIEYLSMNMFGWNGDYGRQMEILLPDGVALHFVRQCNKLRYLDYIFQDITSARELERILNEKVANGERSPLLGYPHNLLLMPKQYFQFSHSLFAFCEHKPRNHVFCAIREAGLAAVPPDFFYTKPLETRPKYHLRMEKKEDEEE